MDPEVANEDRRPFGERFAIPTCLRAHIRADQDAIRFVDDHPDDRPMHGLPGSQAGLDLHLGRAPQKIQEGMDPIPKITTAMMLDADAPNAMASASCMIASDATRGTKGDRMRPVTANAKAE